MDEDFIYDQDDDYGLVSYLVKVCISIDNKYTCIYYL